MLSSIILIFNEFQKLPIMKWLIRIFCFFSMTILFAQSPEAEIRQTVVDFFEAFHAQDSVRMKLTVHPDIILQTIGTNKEGLQQIRTENFNDLVRSIISIPETVQFEEKILDYSIHIDGPMANAWTPYEFWLNNEFHHCGVNSFQLFNDAGTWKIIYLIDTRRAADCAGQTD